MFEPHFNAIMFYQNVIICFVTTQIDRHKKSAGICHFAYPADRGSRIAFGYRISNAEAHALWI